MQTTLTLLFCLATASLIAQDQDNDQYQDNAQSITNDLRLAELRMTTLVHSQKLETIEANEALAAAEYELQLFNDFGMANTEKSLKLDLSLEQDALSDAIEELEQLNIMYDRNNLADTTAQMVLDRAERNLTRMRITVELAESAISEWQRLGLFRRQQELNSAVTYAKLNLNYLHAEHTSSRTELSYEIDALKEELAAERSAESDE